MRSQLSDPQRQELRSLIASAVCKIPELGEMVTKLRGNDDFELLVIAVLASACSGGSAREATEFLRENGVCCVDLERCFRAIRDRTPGRN
jgi:hypothetical protein